MTITAVIAEDNQLYRAVLRRILAGTRRSVQVIGEASDGVATIEMVERLQPDLLLLDVNMPRLNGFGVLVEVRRRHPGIKILMMTMYRDLGYSNQALAKGANGYCTKDAHFKEIVAAIDAVLNGETYSHPGSDG